MSIAAAQVKIAGASFEEPDTNEEARRSQALEL
jgi:hypothetical protein